MCTEKMSTRAKKAHSVIGDQCLLPLNTLPLDVDVGRHYLALTAVAVRPKRSSIIDQVSSDVEDIWKRASIPTIPLRSIERKIRKLLDRIAANKRNHNPERDLNVLFDICLCQCKFLDNCICKRENKVNLIAQVFCILSLNHLFTYFTNI
jgi:hypothetical protein